MSPKEGALTKKDVDKSGSVGLKIDIRCSLGRDLRAEMPEFLAALKKGRFRACGPLLDIVDRKEEIRRQQRCFGDLLVTQTEDLLYCILLCSHSKSLSIQGTFADLRGCKLCRDQT